MPECIIIITVVVVIQFKGWVQNISTFSKILNLFCIHKELKLYYQAIPYHRAYEERQNPGYHIDTPSKYYSVQGEGFV